jgi:hypothetical protein
MNIIDKISVGFFGAVFIFSAVLYTDYITKRNTMLRDVMFCMEDDNSMEAYKSCVDEYREKRY